MKLSLQRLNLRPVDKLDAWVARQISSLGSGRRIDEAKVRLARLENASPAFEVSVQLVTPGPDVFAAGRDHTLRAAVDKTIALLRARIEQRAEKRLQRARSNAMTRRAA